MAESVPTAGSARPTGRPVPRGSTCSLSGLTALLEKGAAHPAAIQAGGTPWASTPSRVRPLAILTVATAIGSIGLAAGGTAAPLLAAELAGTEAVAGLPLGILVAGSALSALVISRRTRRAGRLSSLALGYVGGALGAVVVMFGAVVGALPVVLVGTLLLGAANAAIFLTRYAAAEVAGPPARGRAIGTTFFATTVGAVAGPNLLAPGRSLAEAIGLPGLAGLFVLAAPSFGIAGLILATGLRARGSRLSSDAIPPLRSPTDHGSVGIRGALRAVPARISLVVLATTNLVMVAIMAVAPVHMLAHGDGLGFVGLVVSIHITGMFAPSPVTGWLSDRLGSVRVAAFGIGLLLAIGVLGARLDLNSESTMLIFLTSVGIGWNAGIVGGSALLAASVPDDLRPRSEGLGEVAMGLGAAAGAPGAGLIVAFGGLGTLSIVAALAAALALGAIGLGSRHGPRGVGMGASDFGKTRASPPGASPYQR